MPTIIYLHKLEVKIGHLIAANHPSPILSYLGEPTYPEIGYHLWTTRRPLHTNDMLASIVF